MTAMPSPPTPLPEGEGPALDNDCGTPLPEGERGRGEGIAETRRRNGRGDSFRGVLVPDDVASTEVLQHRRHDPEPHQSERDRTNDERDRTPLTLKNNGQRLRGQIRTRSAGGLGLIDFRLVLTRWRRGAALLVSWHADLGARRGASRWKR